MRIDGILRDITERKRAEEELRRSDEALRDALAKLRASHEELSTPVVQIWDHVLALPLIGIVDDTRAQKVMEVLLNTIVETQSELVILDITGMATIDTNVTDHLMKTVRATSLLGAQCVITGIRPEMTHTVTSMGLDLSRFVIKRDMQEGLKWALKKMGYGLRNGVRPG